MESEIVVHHEPTEGIWPVLAFMKTIKSAEECPIVRSLPPLLHYLPPESLELAATDTKPGEEDGGKHITLLITLWDGSTAMVVCPRNQFIQMCIGL